MNAILPNLILALLALLALSASAATRYVDLNSPSPAPPYTSWTTAATNIQDAIDISVAGDETVVTNGVYAIGGRAIYGIMTNRVVIDKPITVRSVNGPEFTVIRGRPYSGGPAMRCVSLIDGSTLSGFTLTSGATWNTGNAIHEQSGGAVHSASRVAVVTNCIVVNNRASSSGGGVYGCTLYDCTLVDNYAKGNGGAAAQSWLFKCTLGGNNAAFGGGAYGSTLVQCSIVTNYAAAGGGAAASSLNECSLSNNSAVSTGGGVSLNSFLTNCRLTGNTATYGGGAAKSTLTSCLVVSNSVGSEGGGLTACWVNNSILFGNSSVISGGGADSSEVRNCTIVGNFSHADSGGVSRSIVFNSIVYSNASPIGPNYDTSSQLYFSCISPTPLKGFGNITNAPLLEAFSTGNLRLNSNSPCINGGRNAFVNRNGDYIGSPRIDADTVDIGAYEQQGVATSLPYAWAQNYGLPLDGSADHLDADNDGMSNWQEAYSDTNPTNALSMLQMLEVANVGSQTKVTWQSVQSRSYRLEQTINLAFPFQTVATNIAGLEGITAYTNAASGMSGFYRVGVE